ncbi:MAG: WD40/YVTN/BNR-like repeat-containing protein [Gammaproteobacteria bacterium]
MKTIEKIISIHTRLTLFAVALYVCSTAFTVVQAEQAIEVLRTGIPHDSLYDIDINGDNGYAVGNAGLLLVSSDAGATWSEPERMTNQAFLCVKSKGDRTLIAGQKGTIMSKTGNADWETLDTPFETRIMQIDFNKSGLIVAVGEFGLIHRSKDGGNSWDDVTLDWAQFNDEGYEPHLYDVTVKDDGTVVIAGEFGLILWSEDGGDNFVARHQGDESVFALHLDGEGTGTSYAVGQDGLVLRSQDGGSTWQSIELGGEEANLLGVWSGQGEVVITGIRSLFRSSDDGQSWTRADDVQIVRRWYQGVTTGVSEVEAGNGFLRSQAVYIVGQEARIARVVK